MGEYTKDKPKCLVSISDIETILSRQIKMLLKQDINHIIITTGPFAKQIEKMIAEMFPFVRIEFVYNYKYTSTNYIYSLLLVKKYINDNVLLVHGDLVFEQSILEKLIQIKNENAVMLNREIAAPEKDFKGRLIEGYIREIAVDIHDDDCFFLIPMYKLSKAAMLAWFSQMELYEKSGNLNVYAENALNDILQQIALEPVYFDKELCSEIDDVVDLFRVREVLKRFPVKYR